MEITDSYFMLQINQIEICYILIRLFNRPMKQKVYTLLCEHVGISEYEVQHLHHFERLFEGLTTSIWIFAESKYRKFILNKCLNQMIYAWCTYFIDKLRLGTLTYLCVLEEAVFSLKSKIAILDNRIVISYLEINCSLPWQKSTR